MFVADDIGAWLVALLAEAARKRLTGWALGSDQERSLRQAATAAVELAAKELRPNDGKGAEELAMVVSEVFRAPVPGVSATGQQMLLEVLQGGVVEQLAGLDDAGLTGTGRSSADVLGLSTGLLVERLTSHLVQEIIVRGAHGGPLAALANQLNHDVTHLQGQRLESMFGQLAAEVLHALARLDTIYAVAAAPVALAQLPAATAGFTGRQDEMAALIELLDPARASAPVVVSAVAGLAGVGKTTLAVEAGHAVRQRGWFPGGALFIDLHGYDYQPVEPGQALDALLRALGVAPERIPPTMEERAGLYRSVLAAIADPVLVIVDNASSETQARPLLPGSGPHRVVVTSRHTLAGLAACLVDVTELDDAVSVKLLDTALRAARPEDDRISRNWDTAARLAQMCGGLPLALQIVAAILKADRALTVGELADDLAEERNRLERLRYDDETGAPALSVEAAFELSYRRLHAGPARVFRMLPLNPGLDLSTDSAVALTGQRFFDVRKYLGYLARVHMIEATPGAVGRWRMHDLVRLYARRLSDMHADDDGQEQARDRLLSYYLKMAHGAVLHLVAFSGAPESDPNPRLGR